MIKFRLAKILLTLAAIVLPGLATMGLVTAIVYREIVPEVLTWYVCLVFGLIVIGIWYYVLKYLVKFWKATPEDIARYYSKK
jgi:hypothetical protein